MKFFDGLHLVNMIKSSRLRWMEQLEQREERTLSKKIYRGNIGGRRSKGTPKKIWFEYVEEDLRDREQFAEGAHRTEVNGQQ